MPSQAHRQRPLQSVPSPLPQIPPCPSFSLGEGMLQPAPPRCPSSCTAQQPPRNRGSCGRGAAGRGSCPPHNTTASAGPSYSSASPRCSPALWQGEGVQARRVGPPGTDGAKYGRRRCQAAPGTLPDGGAGAVRSEGAGSKRKAPSPARTPDPARQPGTCPCPALCPHSTQHSQCPL